MISAQLSYTSLKMNVAGSTGMDWSSQRPTSIRANTDGVTVSPASRSYHYETPQGSKPTVGSRLAVCGVTGSWTIRRRRISIIHIEVNKHHLISSPEAPDDLRHFFPSRYHGDILKLLIKFCLHSHMHRFFRQGHRLRSRIPFKFVWIQLQFPVCDL